MNELSREDALDSQRESEDSILDFTNVPTQDRPKEGADRCTISKDVAQICDSIDSGGELTTPSDQQVGNSCASADSVVITRSPPQEDNNRIRSIKTIESEYAEQEMKSGWSHLYAQLTETSVKAVTTFSAAELPQNDELNRYSNILADDSTRVKLTGLNTDYINANFVGVASAGTKYVLTQGPLLETSEHFWHLIWQLECPGVVMLNKLVERGMEKCYKYFPSMVRDRFQFGAIRVTCENREKNGNYIRTKLKLENGSDSNPRFLTHFQYTHWPDFGAPASPHSFLTFLSAVRATGILHDPRKPSVIHCSAGVGRSGTFILIDSCLLMADRDRNDVSILDTVLEMRRQRSGCIQSLEQLRFSYECIIHGVKQDNKIRNGNSDVSSPDKLTKRSRIGSSGDCKDRDLTKKKKL